MSADQEADRNTIAEALRPRAADVEFDLERGLASVVHVRCEIDDDALTAPVLGTEREGNGVVIGEGGLVLTIGYLVTEAHTVWLRNVDGAAAAAYVVAYDQPSGLGLVKALMPFATPVLPLGSAVGLEPGKRVVMAGFGGRGSALKAQVLARAEFAGYWEYVLEDALFTTPSHPSWGGAALLTSDGRLAGIGSLHLHHARPDGEVGQANMSVPIDVLPPILDDLLQYGRRSTPARPWLGLMIQDVSGHLVVSAVYPGCPGERAGVRVGDMVLAVAGQEVSELAELFRAVWAHGAAGVTVELLIVRNGEQRKVQVHTADREHCLKKPPLH